MIGNKIIKEIGEDIKRGEIGVIPTDTIYGIVCSAFNKKGVEKIYKLRKRNPKKQVCREENSKPLFCVPLFYAGAAK